jgi:peptidoglycan/xylan/chitin deacetylase (PgdA/CDA1 family)
MLTVVNYHYLRHAGSGEHFPVHALRFDSFREHLSLFRSQYEMATMESALAFLQGRYTPRRDLCLLTFDDGLREHYTHVAPLLLEEHLSGVFFVVTSSLDGEVATVHRIHLLMAALGEPAWWTALARELHDSGLGALVRDLPMQAVRRAYRFDAPDTARAKYLLNYTLSPAERDPLLSRLFDTHVGHVGRAHDVAQSLYFDWSEAAEMQYAGLTIGGHSHTHVPLASRTVQEQQEEISLCARRLEQSLGQEKPRPFSYPHGSFDASTIACLREAGFSCAFTTVPGPNEAGADLFTLRRADAIDVSSTGVVERLQHA